MKREETKDTPIAPIPKTEQTIKITIGVPCYNVAPYLSRCLDSVLTQTYRNLEIVAVDDGSTDDTGAILDAYEKKDPRIRVVHQENRGLGGARNTAINEATGEYVAFVDSDDYIDAGMYETMLSLALKENADIVVCKPYHDAETTAPYDGGVRPPVTARMVLLDAEAVYTALVEEDKTCDVRHSAWNKLFRRSLFGDLRFPERRKYEDIAYIPRLIGRASRICFLDLRFYHYVYDRAGSIMNEGLTRAILTDQIPTYRERTRLFREAGLQEITDANEYQFYKRILLYYTAARRAKDKETRALKTEFAQIMQETRGQLDRIYGCRIANPHEKLRAKLFLAHPFFYNCFMDLNDGVILPLRRRLRRT